MWEDKLLHVFLTMLNDGFRSFVYVFIWLKELIVQRSQQLYISLIGLTQHDTEGLERLLSYQRNHRRVDRIIHHRLLCCIGKLRGWYPGNNPGNTHARHNFPACQMANNLARSPSALLLSYTSLYFHKCLFYEFLISFCELL